jgi:ERG8-type phosphomevalonate kinase
MSGERNTLVGTPVVMAPGKIFLVGEYAVLEECPAVLAAVTRHAVAQYVPGMDPMSAVVAEAVKRARAAIGEEAAALPPGSVLVNTDDFQQGDQKIGLGSSAATAVAAVGALFESAGIPVEKNRPQIFTIADAAHRAAQGGMGSGADVAAAVHGGLIKVERQPAGAPLVEPLTPPAGLHLVVFWTGQAVSTTNMIQGVQKFARRDPAAYHQMIDNLREIAERFVAELRAGSATGAVAAAGRYGRRLAVLGAAASVPIVTDAFTRASELAKELGGIAKPSGAGGGDIGIAMFATPETARLFARALQRPLAPLELDLDRVGVRRRSPGETSDENSGLFHV